MSFGNRTTSAQCRNTLHALCTDKRCACRCHNPDQEVLFEDVRNTEPDGVALRDEALERVEANANEQWMHTAWQVLCRVARMDDEFTSDAVWDILNAEHPEVHTHEPRAMGALMKRGQRAGLMEPTDKFVRTPRPQAHKAPVMVWKSLVR